MSRNILLAILCMVLILLITITSAFPFGFSKSESTVFSVSEKAVIPIVEEGTQQYYGLRGPVVHQMILKNSFLPRQYVLPRANACLFNSETKRGMYLTTRWQVSQLETGSSAFGESETVINLGLEERTVDLVVDVYSRWKPAPVMTTSPQKPAVPFEPETFDKIYLFLTEEDNNDFYPICENLQSSDMMFAKEIVIV